MRQAGATEPLTSAVTEIEIMPEMIEAGVVAYSLWEIGEDAAMVVTSIFKAMISAQQKPMASVERTKTR
jgi:hypothetical protein